MKQMWDKKEIETLIDEHGGGGSGAKWGQITGTLSDQTDLKNALDAKQDTIDSSHKLSVSLVDGLATVATTGDYDDLLNKPTPLTIDEKTIITDAETGDIKTAIGGYVKDNSTSYTTNALSYDQGYYGEYNTPENTTLYNLFNSLEVNQHFDIYLEKSSDGETWEADSNNPIDCYIVYKDPQNSEVQIYNDDVYDNSFTCTDTMIEINWFGDFDDGTYVRMRIVIEDVEIEEIDGRVIPVDGTTITLNSSNELQGFSGDYTDLTNKPTIPTNADYVDRTTSQTIEGIKIFNSDVIINRPSGQSQKALYFGNSSSYNGFVDIKAYGSVYRDTYIDQIGVFDHSSTMTKNFCPYQNAGNFDFNLGGYGYGGSIKYWKDLYLNGNITDGTNSVSVANIATLNTAQEFTANKTFSGELNFKAGASDASPIKVYKDGSSLKINISNFDKFSFNATSFVPEIDGSLELGGVNKRFGGIYTTWIGDGTNGLYVANIADKTNSETWTFTLSDGTTTTKTIVLG